MAQHRLAQTGLVARTTSSASDVLAMATATAGSQQPDWFRGIGPISVLSRNDRNLELAGMGGIGNRFRQIVFTLSTTADGDQVTVRTRITWYRTSQNTILGFIPAGPKTMLGFKSYELFLTRVKSTLEQADRTAIARIVPDVNAAGVPTGSRS